MIHRLAFGVLLVVSGAAGAAGQDTIQLRDPGPRGGPPAFVRALRGPYTVIPPGGSRAVLSPKTPYDRTVIVLGRDVVVEDTVRGDVIVVGGDAYMHPGADVSGGVIAIGGGVYESTAARVGAGVRAYREFTYAAVQIPGGWALTYQPVETADESFVVEGTYGLRVPAYDRSDGLSLPVAPSFQVPRTGARLEPRVTYRSQLGRLDPSIVLVDSLDRRTGIRLSVGRSTFTNDAWAWTDLVNSLEVLWRGDDSRNYYRATRGEITIGHRWISPGTTITPYVGARLERAASVRPGLDVTTGPWSFFSRHDPDDMLRPNPPVDAGVTRSLLTGFELQWTPPDIVARLRMDEEVGAFKQDCVACTVAPEADFAQTTVDGTIAFPTFGTQRLRVDAHAMITSHGATPPQRWAYLGGSATIPTLEMLSRGGDQLVYLDARYDVPVERVKVPLAGSPTVTLREIVGGAAFGRFPTLAQATGVRLAVSVVYVEWLIDPVTRRQHRSYGITIGR